MFLITSAFIALAANAATSAVDIEEPNPKSMSPSEIRTFNAKIGKEHRYFIRCKRDAPTGSLVQRSFVCRTNEQWAATDSRGNQEARDVAERMANKAASGN